MTQSIPILHFDTILQNAVGYVVHERGVNFWSQGHYVVSCHFATGNYHVTHTPTEWVTIDNGMRMSASGFTVTLETGEIPISRDALMVALAGATDQSH